MEVGGSEAGLRGFEDAVAELSQELGRLAQNLQALTQYQATLLSVNKSLCSWMENISELSKHRKRLPTCAAPGK